MSFNDDYLKLRKKRLEEQQKQILKATLTADDIAPVYTPIPDNIETKNTGSGLFKAGAFSDGYQFGDVAKTILGTAGDTALGIVHGASGLVEGLTDLLLYGASGLADISGNNDMSNLLKEGAKINAADDIFGTVRETTNLDDNSLLGDFGYGIAQGVGQVGAIIATGGVGSAAGLGTVGTTALTTGMTGLSSMGSGMSEAYQGGATDKEALAYGISKGVIDAGTELIFGGLGKAVKAVGVNKGISSLDDVFAKKISSKISNQFFKNAAEYGIKAGAEGLEEVLAGLGSAAAKKLTYMSEEELSQLVEDENLLEQFVAGTIVSGIAQSGDLVKSTKQGRDFITNFSANEETVIEKVYNDRVAEAEQDGKKLTNKEKNKLYEQVQEDMRKGYISTDTIESVLGGETYKTYKEAADRDTALKKEYEALNKEYTELYKMKSGEKSDEQIDRQADLKKQLAELKQKIDNSDLSQLKANLSKEVYDSLTRKVGKDGKNTRTDDFLIESYNESARRGTAFEADLSQYDDKTAEVVKRAIDSKILNNTRRTHEFVDMVAKISADKGVPFDFTNNKKLKESGFAVGGASVNGYVTKDGITVNISSSKAMNTIVGHEITHVLEGTELYAEMQKALFEYAKSKNDYDSRRKALEELYKNVKGADIDAELTADLVGDYLFTDADFINNLSTKHRNVFQKIYDEIKYLLKIATKGSKEARELEKVKRAFDKAYRANGNTGDGTKYSLSNDGDTYSRIYDMQVEVNQLRRSIQEFENSDDFKSQMSKLSEAIANDDIENGVKAYAEWKKKSGYDELITKRDTLQAELEKLNKEYNDSITNKALEEEKAAIAKSGLSEADYFRKQAVKEFGYTPYFYDAGYITPNGKMLNFSGEKGYHYGGRGQDHRAIGTIYADTHGSDALNRFVKDGNIRIMAESPGIDISTTAEPTKEQYATIRKFIYEYADKGFFNVDLTDESGRVIGSLNYENRINPARILNDIKHYYATGEIRQQSNVDRFRFSLSNPQTDKDYLDAVERGDMETAQRMVYEAAKQAGYTDDASWKMQHTAPNSKDDVSLYDLKASGLVPDDYWTHPHWYQTTPEENESFWKVKNAIETQESREAKGIQRDATMWVYRAVDKTVNTKEDSFRNGDWVTPSYDYAVNEGRMNPNGYRIIKQRVSIKDLYWDGNSIAELGYDDGNTYAYKDTVNNRKLLDPVTYDDFGKVIPLSKRFKYRNSDVRYSLSKESETPKRYGNYNIFGEDIRFEAPTQEEVAPIQEDVAHESEVVAKNAIPTEDVAPMPNEPTIYDLEQKQAELEDTIRKAMESNDPNAPKLIDEYGELLDTIAKRKKEESTIERERLASLDDADIPPEMEAPYYGESTDAAPENPFEERDIKAVGNRQVKVYMYENPEVKPFFQEEANIMLGELRNATKGEKIYTEVEGGVPGAYGSDSYGVWSGTKRQVSSDIEYLLDELHYSYAEIEKGLNAIIEDHGAENNAISKRIEFILNDRLLKGYAEFTNGYDIPPNQEYIKLLKEKQITEYSDEARAKFFEEADKYAPPMEDIAPIAENTTVHEPKIEKPIEDAPIAEAYEAINPKKIKSSEPRMKRVSDVEPSPSGKERKWVGTSTESEAVDGKILPEDLDQEAIHYQPISNKKTLDTANAKLDGMGYESSLAYFNSQFANKKTTVEDVVLGERLIQEAIKRGDTKTAGELIEDVAILGTELGQKVQALSIIKRLTPEGQLRMLQRTVERGKTRGDKAYEGVEITQEMIDKILKTYGKDGSFDQAKLNEAVEDAKQKVADQMNVSKMDKINAWRYLSMLGNPKTHIRNLVSNVAMRGTTTVKNVVARTIETFAPIENRTKTWRKASDEVKAFSQKTAIEMKDILSDGGKYNEDASIKQKRAIFKNKILNGVYEFNSDMLSKEDWWFSKPAFTNALSEYLTANGITTAQDIQNNPKIVEKAKRYATEQSQIATFRQYSWLANKINEIEHKNVATQIAAGAVLPFKKTPINIAKTALNYSPLGFAKTLTYDASQVKNGKMEASELVDHLAQNVTGSALVLIGYMLASAGFLNGAGEDDKEGKYDYQLGKQAYSINIGDATFSLSWLSPIAMPLFVGANAYEQLVEGKEWNGDVVVETLAQTLDPLSEMSFLSSLDSVLSSYDSGIEKFAGIAQSAGQSYITQFVPTLSSQVAAVMDDTKRSTKVAADSDFKFVDETVNKLKYKIPFLRETLEPSTDIWGNEVKQSENVMERAFETFIAPYAKKKDISSGVDEEIKALYRETGDAGLIPSIPYNYINYDGEKYEMSASEYTEYKKIYGQSAYELMSDLFNTSTYKNASSEERADMVNKVYDFARDEAKREYFAKYGVDFTNATKDGKEYYKENSIKGAIEYDMTPDEYEFVTKNPEKYTVSKAVASDVVTYRKYVSDLYDIKADKDEDGKSISGSRKEKVIDYINNLDIDYGAKLILFKSEYNSDNTYNYEIIDYLNNRQDISYEDMETILKELGFTVLSDGTIQWD